LGIFLHKISGNVFKSYRDLLSADDTYLYNPTDTCIPFNKKLFLTVNGNIFPCEKIGNGFPLGRVTKENVEIDFSKIATFYSDWYRKMHIQCKMCYFSIMCVQCLYFLEEKQNTTFCPMFMDKESFEKFCNNQVSLLEKYPEMYKRIMEELIRA
jgi:uncharacterized protein